jgi:prephenate dehydrogenase
MFAPSIGFAGQNVVVVPIRDGQRVDEVRQWLADWQARTTEMSADEHDRRASLTQTATHTAVLTFGLILLKSGYSIRDADRVSTPAHRALLAQLARIAGSDPEIYWKILHDNPHSAAVLDQAAAAVEQIRALAGNGSQQQLGELLASIREMLGEEQDTLFERSSRMFQLDNDQGPMTNVQSPRTG